MKVLWITNILFPEAEYLLTGTGELKSSGGWMTGLANVLIESEEIDLYVATVSNKVTFLRKFLGDGITYYIIPLGKGKTRINDEYEKYWITIKKEIQPDIIHIHGTEFSHGYAYMKACGRERVVISIQGMTSAYYYYYYYGITKAEIFKNLTIRDLIKGTVIRGQKEFKKRSEYEIAMLKMTNHVIGRTSWDKARTWSINPEATYYFCNEVLRPEFYDGAIWNYDKCIKHSIFLSQAGYPIKGLHQVLKALPIVLKKYPDTVVRVAGGNIIKDNTIKDKLRMSGYGHYIKSLIKYNHLEKHVSFIGNLDAIEMRDEYLKANVFICPSSIENSPNSLGEAQILGVPCIASYVGGVMDMMKGNEENLYRFEEIEMLAEKICRVFANGNNQADVRLQASYRHDRKLNCETLMRIYHSIIDATNK